jgi:hypothetical protein
MKLPRCRWPCVLAVLLAAVLLVPIQTIRWSGGFPSAEFRLRFTDPAGQPVPGVTLRVESAAGGPSYFYPVNEFQPEECPTSDADGAMVFHHVGDTLEFGGREHGNLVGMRFGETKAPQYVCVFSLAGRDLARVRYDDLRERGKHENRSTVTRTWRQPEWAWRKWMEWNHDWDAHEKRLFDGSQDGRLDREEAVAAWYFGSKLAGDSPQREEKEVTYTIYERTVTVPAP